MPQAPRRFGRWYLPATTLLVMGYAVTAYLDRAYSPTRSTGLSNAEQRALEQKERNAALMAAYDQRESLEDMQKAMAIYEVR
ncbi:hypothetical protein K490DRAFT_66728 [Saccharata proteae CBS 121410]|uniref:Uncharacterized protein n=1 Tax=Saccharata proteae CBS 121410 TaxID=1314787 RepID=A0A9P4LUH8_9PEZI|nr:hypothetical protein K490DRAFT_66728 [Saccharata proteae CBS 121410]